MSLDPQSWPPLEDPIIFSATRGDENLHVQVIGGMDHPSGNPQLLAVVLKVRLGPDITPDPGEPTGGTTA